MPYLPRSPTRLRRGGDGGGTDGGDVSDSVTDVAADEADGVNADGHPAANDGVPDEGVEHGKNDGERDTFDGIGRQLDVPEVPVAVREPGPSSDGPSEMKQEEEATDEREGEDKEKVPPYRGKGKGRGMGRGKSIAISSKPESKRESEFEHLSAEGTEKKAEKEKSIKRAAEEKAQLASLSGLALSIPALASEKELREDKGNQQEIAIAPSPLGKRRRSKRSEASSPRKIHRSSTEEVRTETDVPNCENAVMVPGAGGKVGGESAARADKPTQSELSGVPPSLPAVADIVADSGAPVSKRPNPDVPPCVVADATRAEGAKKGSAAERGPAVPSAAAAGNSSEDTKADYAVVVEATDLDDVTPLSEDADKMNSDPSDALPVDSESTPEGDATKSSVAPAQTGKVESQEGFTASPRGEAVPDVCDIAATIGVEVLSEHADVESPSKPDTTATVKSSTAEQPQSTLREVVDTAMSVDDVDSPARGSMRGATTSAPRPKSEWKPAKKQIATMTATLVTAAVASTAVPTTLPSLTTSKPASPPRCRGVAEKSATVSCGGVREDTVAGSVATIGGGSAEPTSPRKRKANTGKVPGPVGAAHSTGGASSNAGNLISPERAKVTATTVAGGFGGFGEETEMHPAKDKEAARGNSERGFVASASASSPYSLQHVAELGGRNSTAAEMEAAAFLAMGQKGAGESVARQNAPWSSGGGSRHGRDSSVGGSIGSPHPANGHAMDGVRERFGGGVGAGVGSMALTATATPPLHGMSHSGALDIMVGHCPAVVRVTGMLNTSAQICFALMIFCRGTVF